MSEPIDPASINESTVYITDRLDGKKISGTFTISQNKTIVSFKPDRALLPGRAYVFEINGIKDLAGNRMASPETGYFRALYATDNKSPKILATTVADGQDAVPINARFRVLFDEPIDGLSLNYLSLYSDGIEVPVERTIETKNTVLSIKPIAPLKAQQQYQLRIGAAEDSSGNVIEHEKLIRFTTSSASDTQSGAIKSVTPDTENIPLNARIEVTLNEPVDPTTFSNRALYLLDTTEGHLVDATLEIGSNKQNLFLIPSQPLKAWHRYEITANDLRNQGAGNDFYFYDLAGNRFASATRSFITGAAIDSTAPAINQFSFANGSINLPINTQISMAFSEPLNMKCVNTETIRLIRKGDGRAVEGAVKLASNGLSVNFVPTAALAADTSYQMVAQGACDLANNNLPLITHEFTTGSNVVADKTPPTIISKLPSNGSTDIALESTIALTLSEAIDPTQLDRLIVTTLRDGVTNFNNDNGQIAGSWSLTANQLIFTQVSEFKSACIARNSPPQMRAQNPN